MMYHIVTEYYVVEERSLLGDLAGVVILLFIAQWELDTLIALLPGILAFLIATFALCTIVTRVARETGTDERLDDIRGAGINPFASISGAVDAIALALPPRLYRWVCRLGAEAEDAVLWSGIGCLLAFGLACYATGALANWQRTGHWNPLMPSLVALVGATTGAWCARTVRRRAGRVRPYRQPVELLDLPTMTLRDPMIAPASRLTDEAV